MNYWSQTYPTTAQFKCPSTSTNGLGHYDFDSADIRWESFASLRTSYETLLQRIAFIVYHWNIRGAQHHHLAMGQQVLSVKLPPLAGLKKDGWVLIHHVRPIDFRERSAIFRSRLDPNDAGHASFLDDLVDCLFTIVD